MAEKKGHKLFEEFPPVSSKEWEDKVIADLKGANFEKKLVWKTLEGLHAKPYYRNEDLQELKYLEGFPCDFPFVRGTKKNNDWYIRQDIQVENIQQANKTALDVITKGVDSLGFLFNYNKKISEKYFNILINGILLDAIEINFIAGHQSLNIISYLKNKIKTENIDPLKINGSIIFDPLKTLTLKGNFYKSAEDSFEKARKIIVETQDLPNIKVIGVNGSLFHNSGSSISEELGFGLAAATEYLTQLTDRGLSIDDIAPKIKFTFAIGSSYFMEIAKFRAARLLWAKIVEAYNPKNINVAKINIHAVTSLWNKSIYDPYINMLRSQTEAMSATIGGVDSLTVEPFDKAYQSPTEFSERIARSQQILLKKESYFNKVADPSAGSYYIEKFTDLIAEKAWDFFLNIQDKGGYIEAFKQGYLQNEIKATANKRDANLALRRKNLLGVNQFPNFNENIADSVPSKVAKKSKSRKFKKPIAEPLTLYRGAMDFEKMRLKTDTSSKQPKVFMFPYGNLAMRTTRAQFSTNFFACGGFKIIDNKGFTTIDEGIKASLTSNADIVVVCSSDKEYSSIVPEIYNKIKNRAILVVAGAPPCMEDLKTKGITNFIYIKSNLLKSLKFYQKALGII